MQEFNQDEYLDMLNLEDKYTKSPSVWEVSKSFPDCRDIASRLTHDITTELSKYDAQVESDPIFAVWITFDDRHQRLQSLKKYLNLTKDVVNRKELNVEKARQVPIQSLYDFENKRVYRNRMQVSCPFHVDKSPSMVIYTDQQSYHCYSCCTGGDNISFVMRLHGIKFVDAVNLLNGGDND